jgi:LPS-assembly lipoprotein
MRRTVLKTLAILGLAALSGCGFQLRGQEPLPFDGAYIDAAPGSALAATLSKQLALRSKLAPSRDKADVIIKLSDENQRKSILTLSSSGKAQEYRLVYKVTVAASDASGVEALPPAILQQVRDFSYNDQAVLAAGTQEGELRQQMNQNLVQQILNRLAFVRKK